MKMHSTALVTGASAGIGEQIAMVFAEHGHDLVLVARREPELEALAERLRARFNVNVTVHAADLAVDGAADALFEAMADTPIDILVNNAGVLSGGSFRKMSPSAIDNMVRVNIGALTALTHRFIGPMIERNRGRILNVASIAAFQPVPSLAVYAATKAFVLSFSEALSVEVGYRGISVTAVCPGFTETNMLRQGSATSGAETKVPDAIVLDPQRVARDAYDACMAGDAIKVPGLGYAAFTSGTRFIPRWVLRTLSSYAMKMGK
ncbi:MAG: SDR family oxidoreductase [Pseudomonadota bacterium]